MSEAVLYDGGVKCTACKRIIWLRCDMEMHHYPFTKINGGTDTVPLCRECHSLIERIPLGDWPMELSQIIYSPDLPREVILLIMKFTKILSNEKEAYNDN